MIPHPCSACGQPVEWTPREAPTHDCDGREVGYPCECGHFERDPDGPYPPDDRSIDPSEVLMGGQRNV